VISAIDVALLLSPYALIAVALAQCAFFGSRHGARALTALMFPYQILGLHLLFLAHPDVGLAGLQASMVPTLQSVVMLYAFSVTYWIASGLFARRRATGDGHPGSTTSRREAWRVLLVAAVGSALLRLIYQPLLDRLPPQHGLVTASLGASLLVALGYVFFRLPPAERPDVMVPLDRRVLSAQILSVWVVLAILDVERLVTAPTTQAWLAPIAFVGRSMPRQTTELVVAASLTAGSRAARQALTGLPIGITGIVAWCIGVAWMPASFGVTGVLALAVVYVSGWVSFVRTWTHARVSRV
jgi:hypothetical protein